MRGLILAAMLALASCASLPSAPGSGAARAHLARQIADDAAAFNDAYGQAVTGQILLNVLRSRDRLPRHYLSMTGISNAPTSSASQSAGVGSIPFGGATNPFAFGTIAASRSTEQRPSYAVQPFTADTLTRTAFEPTQPYVFAHYWGSGWPRDLLLLLMVERIELTDEGGAHREYINEANTVFRDCPEGVDTQGCDFVRAARVFLAHTEAMQRARVDGEAGEGICGLVEAYAPHAPVHAATPAQGVQCDPVFVVGGARYSFKLRSLDDIIYYVGELMRLDSTNARPNEILEAPVTIRAAGLRGGGRGVPLFRILPEASAPAAVYSAQIEYDGRRYVAGPAIGRSCADGAATGACQDDAQHGDRSSSVLSLIAELLALNQSPDAIRAPDRLIAE